MKEPNGEARPPQTSAPEITKPSTAATLPTSSMPVNTASPVRDQLAILDEGRRVELGTGSYWTRPQCGRVERGFKEIVRRKSRELGN